MIRMMFVCGSLEHGKDGVGDYVCRLGGFLKNQGHAVSAIAWNDKYSKEPIDDLHPAEGVTIDVLRLPASMSLSDKRRLAYAFTEKMSPDVISLQFVAYAFHKKGIPLLLSEDLRQLLKGRAVHVMFHELWLDTPLGIKQKVTALVQQRLIGNLVTKLKPEAVNVSIPFNKLRLKSAGIRSEILGLFGNIYPEFRQALTRVGTESAPTSILYFGSPPKGAFRSNLLDKLMEFCSHSEVGTRLVLVGGTSAAKEEFCTELRKRLSGLRCEIVDHGFLSVAEVSNLMTSCDVGIVRSEPHLLGKSGSAIAMLEHGLPIWLPKLKNGSQVDYPFRSKLIFSDLKEAVKSSSRETYHSLLPAVAEEFLCQIKHVKKNESKRIYPAL